MSHGRQKGGQPKPVKEAKASATKGNKGGDDDDDVADTPIEMGVADRIADIVEKLSIKSAPRRVEALKRFINEMTVNYLIEELQPRADTVTDYLLKCISHRGSEMQLACHALSLLAITLGSDASSIYTTIWPVLQPLFSDPSKPAADRAAAMRTCGVLCFVINNPTHDSATLMNALQDVFTKEKPQPHEDVLAQALESWSLLATALASPVLVQRHKATLLAVFVDLLEHASFEVRAAAGENIALLLSAQQAPDEEEDKSAEIRQPKAKPLPSMDDDSEEAKERREAKYEAVRAAAAARAAESAAATPAPLSLTPGVSGSGVASPAVPPTPKKGAATVSEANGNGSDSHDGATNGADEKKTPKKAAKPSAAAAAGNATPAVEKKKGPRQIDMDKLVATLETLANDSSKKKGKKEKAKQHSLFRDVLDTAVSRDVPSETIKIDKTKHEFEGWAQIIQLAVLRDILGEGFQQHIRSNELLRDVFDLQGPVVDDGRVTKEDTMAGHHERDTARLRSIAKHRSNKRAIQAGALDQ